MKINIKNSINDKIKDIFPLMWTKTPENGSSLAHALFWLRKQQKTGIAEFEGDKFKFVFFFKNGMIHQIKKTGSEEAEEFLQILMEHRLLSGVDLRPIVDETLTTKKSLLFILYERKLLTPDQIVRLMRVRLQNLLEETLTLESGVFLFKEEEVKKQPVFVDPGEYLIYHYKRYLNQYVYKDFVPILEPFFYKFPQAKEVKESLFETKEIEYITDFLNARFNIKTVLERSSLSAHHSARMIFLLLCFDLVDIGNVSLQSVLNEDIVLQIEEKFQEVEKKEHFAIVGAHWTSYITEIDKKYEQTKKKFSDFLKNKTLSKDARQKIKKILKAVDESYEFLKDKHRRKEYRRQLVGEQKIVFAADFLYKQSLLYKFKGDLKNAELYLKAALDLVDAPKFKNALNQLKSA